MRTKVRTIVGLFLLAGSVAVPSAREGHQASAQTTRLVLKAGADTYVEESSPATSYGDAQSMKAGTRPRRVALIKFSLADLQGDVQSARLKLYSRKSVPQGGNATAMARSGWGESTTWSSRPTFAGTEFGAFGAVDFGWHSLAVPSSELDGARLSVALKVGRKEFASWATRESARDPKLVVELAASETDGITQVAPGHEGSSDPTWFANNHRAALTDRGRMLVLHGKHLAGVQLAWRDPGGSWKRTTQGRVNNGILWETATMRTGDWTTSIAIAQDENGVEHAWVVWGGWSGTGTKPVGMTRLSKLDSDNGPRVGPVVPIAAVEGNELGHSKVDIAFESKPGGGFRGVVSCLRMVEVSAGEQGWELVTRWFTHLGTDTPEMANEHVLFSNSSPGGYARLATLEPGPNGVVAVVRGNDGKIGYFSHDADDPLDSWTPGASGVNVSGAAYPTAVVLDNGETVGAVESSAGNVSIVRWDETGTVIDSRGAPGYRQPMLATDGSNVWLLVIRSADGSVVSQEFTAAISSWGSDVVEIPGTACEGDCEWPNAVRRTDGRLRLIVRGPMLEGDPEENQFSVLGFQREI
ncbi:MAG: DNRLRE domain-containing protein [Actinomycetota bacterium]|nr:DNRLRE domain-containing protein [Actinomycetota bacterium]